MRCADSPYWQQRLQTYQPVLSAKCVSPILFVLGVVYVVFGVVVVVMNASLGELTIDYTHCEPTEAARLADADIRVSRTCAAFFTAFPNASVQARSCQCQIAFTLNDTFPV